MAWLHVFILLDLEENYRWILGDHGPVGLTTTRALGSVKDTVYKGSKEESNGGRYPALGLCKHNLR